MLILSKRDKPQRKKSLPGQEQNEKLRPQSNLRNLRSRPGQISNYLRKNPTVILISENSVPSSVNIYSKALFGSESAPVSLPNFSEGTEGGMYKGATACVLNLKLKETNEFKNNRKHNLTSNSFSKILISMDALFSFSSSI